MTMHLFSTRTGSASTFSVVNADTQQMRDLVACAIVIRMLSVRGQYIHTVSHDSMYSKDTASEKYYTTATQMSHDCHMTYIVGTIKLNSQCLSAEMYEVCIASTFTSLNRKTSPRATQVAASLPSHIPHDCTGTPHSD